MSFAIGAKSPVVRLSHCGTGRTSPCRRRAARRALPLRRRAAYLRAMTDSPAAAPKRPSLRQRAAWRVEALFYDLFTGLARAFPLDAVSDFGAAVFRRIGPLTKSHRV